MSPTVRRVLAGAGAWVLGAAASVVVGMLALSIVGGPAGVTAAPAMENRRLSFSASPAGTPAPSSPPPSPSASPPAASTAPPAVGPSGIQRQFTTAGGLVSARCTGQQVYLVSWSPAPGYRADDMQRGPGIVAQVSFKGPPREVVIRLRCVAGVPQMATGRDD